ncbi:TonB C-terminal domain-containing protein [Bradyrhizobium ontarionense]|uniref:TonB C-terminal domain-containing protein n=1 Tax=Bradyrhizobium ontarionense TaxID=2898149 RepID=A0ABY3R7M5_9BRAD|nr:TonB C-terminal domain-containing protein [Bradyrhizobium sp. A19]UFZ03331.1 TonB C-terminal domain-containing protein [Bradyrhizobium sp. A19]
MSELESGTRVAAESVGAGTQPSRLGSSLRFAVTIIVIALPLGSVAYWVFAQRDQPPPPRQVHEITLLTITPPPPPPPPPKVAPPVEQKMVEQPKMAEPEFKEDKPVDKPQDKPIKDAKADQPPGPLSLDAKATGPGDLFGLGGKPGGSPYGGAGGGGSRWGWYASMIQQQIEAALRANDKTKKAVIRVQISLWADSSGRVSRVQLLSSTGDAALDQALRDDVLGSLMLRQPPPKDMPMPIVTRVTASRPS